MVRQHHPLNGRESEQTSGDSEGQGTLTCYGPWGHKESDTTQGLNSAQSLQSCPTPCEPMDCSPPGSSVHGILQARILEWVAMPFSRESSQPRDRTHISCVSCIAGGLFTHWTTWEASNNNRCTYLFDCPRSQLQLANFWLGHMGSSSLTRDQTWTFALGAQRLSHWTTREVLRLVFFFF